MSYRLISISLMALALGLTGCGRGDPNQPNSTSGAARGDAELTAPAQLAGYKSHEGNVYYYETETGELTGVQNLGQFQDSPDLYRLIHAGDLGVQLSDGSIAVVAPGSQVVRLLRKAGLGANFAQDTTLPLDGKTVAATALRDALAGRLSSPTPPSTKPAPTPISNNTTKNVAAQAPGFDCKNAAPGVETTICSNPELSAKDAEVTRLYLDWVNKIGSGAMIDDLGQVKSDQQKWLAERNKCSDAACLVRLYDQRIEELPGSGL